MGRKRNLTTYWEVRSFTNLTSKQKIQAQNIAFKPAKKYQAYDKKCHKRCGDDDFSDDLSSLLPQNNPMHKTSRIRRLRY
ncbi:hypothetical protein P3L10_005093 [Capsicum annuum]